MRYAFVVIRCIEVENKEKAVGVITDVLAASSKHTTEEVPLVDDFDDSKKDIRIDKVRISPLREVR